MPDPTPSSPTAERDRALAAIARRALNLPTLETRRSDSLDFHDVAVWSIAEALRLAWSGGYEKAVEDRHDHGAAALALAVCQALSDHSHNFYDDIGEQIAPIVEAARAALAAAGKE